MQLKNIIRGFLLLTYSSWAFCVSESVSGKSPNLPNYGSHLVEMMLSLLLVLSLIFALAWFFKRINNNRIMPSQVMDVKASLSLSPKEKLMIVQVGDEQIVVGVAPGFVSLIKTLDSPLVVDNQSQALSFSKESFAKTLEKMLKGNKGQQEKEFSHKAVSNDA
jgi:flagellar protein FliO/FliZ